VVRFFHGVKKFINKIRKALPGSKRNDNRNNNNKDDENEEE